MFAPRHLQRIIAGFASIAIVFAMLAPSLSHALTQQNDAPGGWAEICSAGGVRLMAVFAGEPAHIPPAAEDDRHVQHCVFCQPHGSAFLPTADAKPVFAQQDIQRALRLFRHAPRTLPAWITAQPRAPPLAS